MLSRVGLFPTPWTVAHQAPLSMGFPRQECWSGLPFPPPGDLPDLGMEPTSLASPALAGGLFTAWEALVRAEGRRKGSTPRRGGAPRSQPRHPKAATTAVFPLWCSLKSRATLWLYPRAHLSPALWSEKKVPAGTELRI